MFIKFIKLRKRINYMLRKCQDGNIFGLWFDWLLTCSVLVFLYMLCPCLCIYDDVPCFVFVPLIFSLFYSINPSGSQFFRLSVKVCSTTSRVHHIALDFCFSLGNHLFLSKICSIGLFSLIILVWIKLEYTLVIQKIAELNIWLYVAWLAVVGRLKIGICPF